MAYHYMMERMRERNFNYSESGEDTDFEENFNYSEDGREYSDYDDSVFEELLPQNEDTEVKSLQKLCLNTITTNFHRFNTAYTTSEDTTLQRNLLFLQRAYSFHMITQMKGSILDSSLNFLVNEHLEEFHLEMLHNCSHEAILKRLSEIGHGFVKGYLNFSYFDYSEKYKPFSKTNELLKEAVTLLPNIEVLHMSSGDCNNEILQLIVSSCPKLQELYIDNSPVNDEGVKSLFVEKDGALQVKCHLKVLSLKNTDVEAPGIQILLENIPSLQTLNHCFLLLVLYSMHKDDVKDRTTTKEYNLTSLDMNYQQFDNVDLSSILSVCSRVCPHVKSLCSPVMTEKDDLHFISLFSKLEELSLDGLGSTNFDFNNFLKSSCGNLRELQLSCFSLSAPLLLRSCPKLETLSLRDITFQWEDEANSVPCVSRLRKLSLEHFTFQDGSVEKSVTAILNSSPKLEFLEVAHCEFDNSGMHSTLSTFCANSVVQDLHFRCSDVSVISIECILLTCTSLRTLVIHDCENISAENIDSLYGIIHARKTKVNIIWSDDRSELNSIEDDFFDNYDFDEDSDDYHHLGEYHYSYSFDYDEDDY